MNKREVKYMKGGLFLSTVTSAPVCLAVFFHSNRTQVARGTANRGCQNWFPLKSLITYTQSLPLLILKD